MHNELSDLWASAAKWIAGVGIPAVAAWFARQQWKSRAARRRETAEADVEVAIAPDKIKTSSYTNMEAQMVSMDQAFGLERNSLNRTVERLMLENEDQRLQIENKDKRLREALAKIDELQAALNELAATVRAEVASNLPEHP